MTDGFLALLPTLVSVVLTVVTRQVLISLIAGIVMGSLIHSGGLIPGLVAGADTVIEILSAPWFAKNIIFLLLMGGLLRIIEEAGGVEGFIHLFIHRMRLVRSKKGALILPYIAGMGMFLDGIGSMMTAGMVGRPLLRRYNEPREKLAFICNATGAPIAFLFPFGGGAALIMGILGGQIESGILRGSPLNYILRTIPFQFYTIIILLLVPGIIFFIGDFGPMARIYEKRSYLKDIDRKAENLKKGRVDFMLIPLLLLISSIMGIIVYTGQGDLGRGDAIGGIYLGSLLTVILTGAYIPMTSGISVDDVIGWCIEGMKGMLPSIIILVLASALGRIMGDLHTGSYLSGFFLGGMSPSLIPMGIFLSCCVVSFATGSSGATIMIMLPLVIPMGADAGIYIPLLMGAVVSGAIFGDQSSPISDSVIVAAGAAGCDPVDHFETQLPYTLCAAGVSMLMFIISGIII